MMSLKFRILASERLPLLKNLLKQKNHIRVMEVHDGLSALIANNALAFRNKDFAPIGFDALWISSLTDSAAKGHPDIGVIDASNRLLTVNEIVQLTNKPIIVDGDTGGDESQFEYFCSKLELLGVSGVIIEDKKFPKRNSLEADSIQLLEDPIRFATKINRAKSICLTDNFMIFARIESFIANCDLDDALMRAKIYLQSKADGIMIHSSKTTPDQVFAFSKKYNELCKKLNLYKPLICVPTTYHSVHESELFDEGFNIVIYANHALRASHKAIKQVVYSILSHGRSFEAAAYLSGVQEIFEEVGFGDIQEKDRLYKEANLPVILLSAGKPPGFQCSDYQDFPITHIPLEDTILLEKQLTTLRSINLMDITVVTGHQSVDLSSYQVRQIYNKKFSVTKSLYSLFLAQENMNNGFIMIFGDIIFDTELLIKLLNNKNDIVLLIDPKINTHYREKKTLDLAVTSSEKLTKLRKLGDTSELLYDMGSDIALDKATHEFVGVAKFSRQGAQVLRTSYINLCRQSSLLSEKIKTIECFDFSDIIRYMIRCHVAVHGLVVHEGWSEVHSKEDIHHIKTMLA